ncbi:MAG: hypothetical protein M1823_005777 [Watsoniomyces obsoletus]|nr:MAG: hypothetical protein M1823_005777 [Watsoniomyces obsoletus]
MGFKFGANVIPSSIESKASARAANMFRWGKTLDVITLFHKPASASSARALTLLKQASANASQTATQDQASDHSAQNKIKRSEFELNVIEDAPTTDQLRSILEYVGAKRAGDLVHGAKDEADAVKRLKSDAESFRRPVVSFHAPWATL